MFLTVLGPGYKGASVQFRNIDRGLKSNLRMNLEKSTRYMLVLLSWLYQQDVTVAVRAIHSATEEKVKREARVMYNLKHPSFPLVQRIVKALPFSHIIL